LPTATEQDLLVAALGSSSRAGTAWRLWASRHRDPLNALASCGARTLLPLLDVSLRTAGVALAPGVRDGLRAASLSEKRRSGAYDDILQSLIVALGPRRVLVLKGAALAHSVYPERFLRHCHDIDLLVHPDEADAVAGTLPVVGFAPEAVGVWAHRSGLPLRMHRSCFAIAAYDLPFDAVWGRRRQVRIGGVAVPTLAAEDALVQVCGHASYWHGPESLRWVADACYLAAAALDWNQVAATAQLGGLAVPMSLQLDWLRQTLDVEVPDATRRHLGATAAGAAGDCLRAAALGASGTQPRRLLRTLKAAGVYAAPTLLRDAVMPPPGLQPLRVGARTAGRMRITSS